MVTSDRSVDPLEPRISVSVWRVIQSYDWTKSYTMGGDAGDVPENLCGLICSLDDETAERWYTLLHNRIVSQESVFESALPSVHVLIEAVRTCSMTDDAKAEVYWLIYQIVNGETDGEAVDRGNAQVAEQCRSLVRDNIEVLTSHSTECTEEVMSFLKNRLSL